MNVIEAAKAAGFEQVMRHKDGSSTVLPTALFERFAQIIRNQALEDAAMQCDERGYFNEVSQGAEECFYCAVAIRAMKKEQS